MQSTAPTTAPIPAESTTAGTTSSGTTVVLDPGQVEYLANVAQADTLAIIGTIFIGFFFLVGPVVFNALRSR